MIKVTIGTNTDRQVVMAEPDRTIKSLFEEAGVDYTKGTPHIDGTALKTGEINKTLAELGITDKCFIIAVIKVDNAA